MDLCTNAPTKGGTTLLNTNARGLFLTNRQAVRWMLDQPLDDKGLRGTVLNMGSVLGWSPAPHHFGTFAYAAEQGGHPGHDPGRRHEIKHRPHPLQPHRGLLNRHADGHPHGQ